MHIPLSTKDLYRNLSFTAYARIIAELDHSCGSYHTIGYTFRPNAECREIDRIVKFSKLKFPDATATCWVVALTYYKMSSRDHQGFDAYGISELLKRYIGEEMPISEIERIMKNPDQELVRAC
jgi:hypothetical protein